MQPLRFAQIGIGGMGRSHLQALRARDDVELVAVCDTNVDLLTPFADDPVAIATYRDWRELLARDDLDAAIVVLPHYLYPEVVTACLERGLHVLKEKPFAMNLADAQAMLKAAQTAGKTLMVAAQSKFTPSYIAGHSLVQGGVLGQVFLLRAAIIYRWGGAVTNNWRWRGDHSKSGGVAVVDSGWHILDLVHWYRGLPTSVYCSLGHGRALPDSDYDVDDRAALVLDWEDGCVGSVVCCYIALPAERKLTLHGQVGSLIADPDSLTTIIGDNAPVHHDLPADPNIMGDQLEHFIASLRAGRQPRSNATEALQVQRIIEAAYRSAESGQPVKLADLPGSAP